MAAKKRIGRPPKAKEDRKAVNFTFRSRGPMRERLQAAATASGRSISEEIERRLEQSFQADELYGAPRISAVFHILASHILARANAAGHWAEDDQVRSETAKVFADILAKEMPGFHSVTIEAIGPHGEIRGTTGYASDEIAEREIPDVAELRRQRREALASASEKTQREDSR
jgi:hypothetical protein